MNSYKSEIVLMLHKPKCENIKITTIETSNESHFHWKDHFQKNPLQFKITADVESDNEFDNSNTGKKTTKIYKKVLFAMVII